MHLFVESNFILELVKNQEQAEACLALLLAVEQQDVWLHLPAFCLMEPVYTMGALSKERREMQRRINEELIQAKREKTIGQSMDQLQRDLTTTLSERDIVQQERLLEMSIRISTAANLIPLTHTVWLRANNLVLTSSLSLTDALVGASILERLEELEENKETVPSLFVTRDRRAFKLEDIEERMAALGCEVIYNFTHATQRLRL